MACKGFSRPFCNNINKSLYPMGASFIVSEFILAILVEGH